MDESKVKKQILKNIFRKIGNQPNKAIFLGDLEIDFDHIESDKFTTLCDQLINDGLLKVSGNAYVVFTPDGWDAANELINPRPQTTNQTISINKAHNSPIVQSENSMIYQKNEYNSAPQEDLSRFIELFEKHLCELELEETERKKAEAQIKTIKAQLEIEPNPTIIREAGKTLRNITEGAIGSLVASGLYRPEAWLFIQQCLENMFR